MLRVALAVGVDRAALADKITLVVNVIAEQVAELAGHAVVVLPQGIQAVHFAAPCVEAPVDAAAFALAVTTKVGKLGTRVVVLPFRSQNGHVFAFNGFNHAQKGFACGTGAVLSRIGTFRPDHQAAFMRRKFRGHIKPVLRGCGMQNFHSKLSCKVIQEKSTTFCTVKCFSQTDT